jgi:hypothetical protein
MSDLLMRGRVLRLLAAATILRDPELVTAADVSEET